MVDVRKMVENAEKVEEIAGRTVVLTKKEVYILQNEEDKRFTKTNEHGQLIYGAKRMMEEREERCREVIGTEEFKNFKGDLNLKVSQFQDDEEFSRFLEIYEVI